MNGMRSPRVTIHGSKKYTPRRKPANAPALLPLLSQFRMDLRGSEF